MRLFVLAQQYLVPVGRRWTLKRPVTFQEAAGPSFPMSAINCETNAGSHDLLRALNEAADLLDWFNADTKTTDRLYARTASFCTGSSTQFDTWDQVCVVPTFLFIYCSSTLQVQRRMHILLARLRHRQSLCRTGNLCLIVICTGTAVSIGDCVFHGQYDLAPTPRTRTRDDQGFMGRIDACIFVCRWVAHKFDI